MAGGWGRPWRQLLSLPLPRLLGNAALLNAASRHGKKLQEGAKGTRLLLGAGCEHMQNPALPPTHPAAAAVECSTLSCNQATAWCSSQRYTGAETVQSNELECMGKCTGSIPTM